MESLPPSPRHTGRQHIPLKCWWRSSRLHGVTSRKTVMFLVTAMRTSNLMKDPSFVAEFRLVLGRTQSHIRRESGCKATELPSWLLPSSAELKNACVSISFRNRHSITIILIQFYVDWEMERRDVTVSISAGHFACLAIESYSRRW
jgi:hypothetical protein